MGLTSRKTIILTAGHSNAAPGAVWVYDGRRVTEAGIVTRVRNDVAKLLRQWGYAVITDGDGDVNQPLRQAINLMARHNCVECELHCNSVVDRNATGVEVFAKRDKRGQAEALASVIARALDLGLRGLRGWKQANESHHGNLAVLNAGGILAELFFLSNPSNYANFQKYYPRLIQAIAYELARQSDGGLLVPRNRMQATVPVNAPAINAPRVQEWKPAPVVQALAEAPKQAPLTQPQKATVGILAAVASAWYAGIEWMQAHSGLLLGIAALGVIAALFWEIEKLKRATRPRE